MKKVYVTWVEVGYGDFDMLTVRSTLDKATTDLHAYHASGKQFKHGWIEAWPFDKPWTPEMPTPEPETVDVYPYMEDDYINSIVRFYNAPNE